MLKSGATPRYAERYPLGRRKTQGNPEHEAGQARTKTGKRFRDNVLAFNYNLEQELFKLSSELESKTYLPGAYRSFRIYDPKSRLISAAPYRDRVVHHPLCNIIVPLIEKSFIHDTYANRVGYGTHRALERFIKFARSSRYVLQCDIRKYFPGDDLLTPMLRRRGLPIGNLTSQFLANWYLNDFDHFIKEKL